MKEQWECFSTNLLSLMNTFIPKSRLKSKYKNPYSIPEVKRIRKKKYTHWKAYLQTRNPFDYSHYVRLRNHLRATTGSLKRNYEQCITSNLKTQPKVFWKYINSRLRTKSMVDSLERDDGTLAETDLDKAEVLNKFFSSVYTVEDFTAIPSLHPQYTGFPWTTAQWIQTKSSIKF